jgi:hypothetical protein
MGTYSYLEYLETFGGPPEPGETYPDDPDALRDMLEEEALAVRRPCITRKFCGGEETVSLSGFARYVVQDDDMALDIAQRMLGGVDPYTYNEDEPEFYEEFSVLDHDELQRQVEAEESSE